jgi:hypothetical protein
MPVSSAIDLKLRLTVQVALLAALCFLAGIGYGLIADDSAARARAGGIADIVARELEGQMERAGWMKPIASYFPNLEPLATALISPGLCIGYRSGDGQVSQRFCSGPQAGEPVAPDWFAATYRYLFAPGREVLHAVSYRTEPMGDASRSA